MTPPVFPLTVRTAEGDELAETVQDLATTLEWFDSSTDDSIAVWDSLGRRMRVVVVARQVLTLEAETSGS